MRSNSFYCKYIKEMLGRLIALVAIVLLAWLFITIAILIKRDDPNGPVIFRQERIGKNGKVYWMFKFRSMRSGAEHTGSGVYSDRNDPRVTHIGRFLRATSLDELPQLFNVLSGDMALIGFRSPLTYHPWSWEQYTEEQKKMFALKPGITGWAQINGRKTVEWNHRIEMNNWYADHVSLVLDLRILFLTFERVAANRDNENAGATVSKQEA